jgi:Metallo-beta-lactamase superfamily
MEYKRAMRGTDMPGLALFAAPDRLTCGPKSDMLSHPFGSRARCHNARTTTIAHWLTTREEVLKRIVLAALAVTTVAFAGIANAQSVDFSKVEIKTIDLGNNTYRLEGQGGNITVAVGTDGIIMVDGQFAPLHDKIKAAITAISQLPIKYLINTHFHGDHTGGNESFQNDGAVVVAQDNVRVRLAAGTTNGITGAKTLPVAPGALPKQTYIGARSRWKSGAGRLSLLMLTMLTPTATPGSISRMPTCSVPAIP